MEPVFNGYIKDKTVTDKEGSGVISNEEADIIKVRESRHLL